MRFRHDPTTPCASIDPDLWFEMNTATAKRLCGDCDHTVACLAYAVKEKIPYGVWGGQDEDERRKVTGGPRGGSRLSSGCIVEGCENPHRGMGMCNNHLQNFRRAQKRAS